MSSIFENVELTSNRRKCKILNGMNTAKLFDVTPEVQASAHEVPILKNQDNFLVSHTVSIHVQMKIIIYAMWTLCMLCAVLPMLCAPVQYTHTHTIGYDCKYFYLMLLVLLPCFSIHTFCYSLVFYRSCRHGVILGVMGMYMIISSLQNTCIRPTQDKNIFSCVIFVVGVDIGIISQFLFYNMTDVDNTRKRILVITIGLLSSICNILIFYAIATPEASDMPTQINSSNALLEYPVPAIFSIYFLCTLGTLYTIEDVCYKI